MGLIKEPRGIDFLIQSEPWTKKELAEFRKLMKGQKAKRVKKGLQMKKNLTKKSYV